MEDPEYSIKKYADNGDLKTLGSFNENDDLYVLSSKPTAKYSKWNVLEGALQEDKKFDPGTPAVIIKYDDNTLRSVGSVNDIDNIFIEDSGTGMQIEAEDFPLYKALKQMDQNDIDEILSEIRKHSKGEDQRKRLIRTFLLNEISSSGGDLENARAIANEIENGQFDELVNILADLDQGDVPVLELLEINPDDGGMQVEEGGGGGGDGAD